MGLDGMRYLFFMRIQTALDALHVNLVPVHRTRLSALSETSMLGIRQLPGEWRHLVAATDGGLYEGLATEGIALFRLEKDRRYGPLQG